MYLTANPLHANCVPLDEHLRVLNDFKIMLEESNAKSDHIITLQKTVIEYGELIIELGEQVKLLRQMHFGKQTEIGEKIIDTTNNGCAADDDRNDCGEELIDVAAYKRIKNKKIKGRLVDMSSLPRYTIFHDLPPECQSCASCGNRLEKFSEKSEQLETISKLVYCVEHIRYKYSCKSCEQMIMAPKEFSPIPKSLAGASLIAEVTMNKVAYHMPCYRQSKILANAGIDIPDNTIGKWIMDAGNALLPLAEQFWREVAASQYLQVDETPVKVLKPEKKGYIWVYYNPMLDFVVYDLALGRSADNPEYRLAAFTGKLHTDGYIGYNKLHNNGQDAFNCNTHARRKFTDVVKISNNKTGIAAQAVLQLQELYAIEDEARNNNLTFDERKKLRQQKAKPIWGKYIAWLNEQVSLVPPKSRLGGAIQYTLNRLPKLMAYLEHGEVEVDTNGVENLIRPVALGRKNWLFMGNIESGQIYMLFNSLIQSCILQEINPHTYVHYILTKVHALRRGEVSARELLPHWINKELLEQFAREQLELQAHVLNNLVYPTKS